MTKAKTEGREPKVFKMDLGFSRTKASVVLLIDYQKLESELERVKNERSFLHKDDCYYYTPEADQEFKRVQAELSEQAAEVAKLNGSVIADFNEIERHEIALNKERVQRLCFLLDDQSDLITKQAATIDKIDDHLRKMRADGEITMKQMCVALKVLSDGLRIDAILGGKDER